MIIVIILLTFVFVFFMYYAGSHTSVIFSQMRHEPVDTTADALGLVQSFLSLFALVIAFFTLIFGIIAWWLQQRFSELDKIQSLSEAHYNNLLSIIELTIDQLPSMTFTQQIPSSFVRHIQGISRFIQTIDEQNFWVGEWRSKSRPRLYYTLGLLEFSGAPSNPPRSLGTTLLIGNDRRRRSSEQRQFKSAIDRLVEARSDPLCEKSLQRDILVRLVQIYRQHCRFDEAEDAAAGLETYARGDRDRALSRWSKAVIQLQRGLNADTQNLRLRHFGVARMAMWDVYLAMFGPFSGKGSTSSTFYDPNADANFAYYCAKAIWSYRCAQGQARLSRNNREQREDIEWHERAVLTIKRAHILFEENRTSLDIRKDPAIGAIYNACVAHVILIRRALSIGDDAMAPYHIARMSSSDAYFVDCLNTAKAMLDNEENERDDLSREPSIYAETFERLVTFREFRDELDLLKGWWENPAKMFDFYAHNVRH
jgi:hypothetical protein